jgi:hypothetical protein
MKKIKNIILGMSILFLTSCAVSTPVIITDNVVGEKRGEASFNIILGIIAPMDADASIATAAKNGGITQVGSVDFKVKAGLFKSTYTTIVTGR